MKYCTYITTYTGHKMPGNYVGSSSIEKIINGYRGSVLSKKWKKIWKQELKENPHLFTTTIRTKHETREEALNEELRYQIENNVVKSTDWINESYAQPNGFFGRDVSGSNHPLYGIGHSTEGRKNISKNHADVSGSNNPMYGKGYIMKEYWDNLSKEELNERKKKSSESAKKQFENPSEKTLQQIQKNKEFMREKCDVFLYNDKEYVGYPELCKVLGTTKWFAQKMVKNGEVILIKEGSPRGKRNNGENRDSR